MRFLLILISIVVLIVFALNIPFFKKNNTNKQITYEETFNNPGITVQKLQGGYYRVVILSDQLVSYHFQRNSYNGKEKACPLR